MNETVTIGREEFIEMCAVAGAKYTTAVTDKYPYMDEEQKDALASLLLNFGLYACVLTKELFGDRDGK